MQGRSPYSQDKIRSFGRIRSRRLRSEKQSLYDKLLPKILITLPSKLDISGKEAISPTSPELRTMCELVSEHGGKQIFLEIGFGQGEHLAMQAKSHPNVQFIGCEPFINGIGALIKAIFVDKLVNIRVYNGDARDLMEALPEVSISKCFILFPDPWPKARHHKRRLINAELLKELARIIKPGGELLIATDHEDYLTWILERIFTQDDFQWTAQTKADWANPPAEWVTTKYQAKAIREGRMPNWINLIRVTREKAGAYSQ